VQAGLNRAAGFLRGEVGRRLGLRHAPKLEFEFDASIERADRLTSLIDTAVRKDQSSHKDDEPA
jgi:ribosome-binding factor A